MIKYMMFFLKIVLIFKVFVDKGMTVLAICVMNEKDCRHYFLMNVLVHTKFIVLHINYN
jgi:hypothetical protein